MHPASGVCLSWVQSLATTVSDSVTQPNLSSGWLTVGSAVPTPRPPGDEYHLPASMYPPSNQPTAAAWHSSIQRLCDQARMVTTDATMKLPTYAECRYASTDPTTNCSTYRTCDSCLQLPGCRISSNGYCEQDLYCYQSNEEAYDHRRAIALNLTLPSGLAINATAMEEEQSWWFPANTTSYCPADNSVCRQCVDNNFWLGPSQRPDSRFCVGGSGTNSKSFGLSDCVCIANCARTANPVWCPTESSDNTRNDSGSEIAPFIGLILLIFVLFMIVTIGGYSLLLHSIRKRKANSSQETQTPAPTTGVSVQYTEAH